MEKIKLETPINDMHGVAFVMTEEIAKRLRNEAVIAALEAESKKEMWVRAAIMVAKDKLCFQFGAWKNCEGVLSFKSEQPVVKLIKIDEPQWGQEEPVIYYVRKLKSCKFSSSASSVDVSYVLSFFKPTKGEHR